MGIAAKFGVAASGLPNAGDQASNVVSGVLTAIGPGDPFAFRGPMDLVVWGSATNIAFATTKGSLNATVSSGTGMAAGGAINSANVPPGTTWATFSGTSGTLALPAKTYPCSRISTSSRNIYLPPGSNVAQLLGATVTVPSNAEQATIPASTTVSAIVQNDVAASQTSAGQDGIITLSAAPTVAPTQKGPLPLRFKLTSNAVTTGTDAAAVFTGAGVTFSGTFQIERCFDGGQTWLPCNAGGTGTLASYSAGTVVSLTFGEPERNVLYRINVLAYTSGNINYRISETGGATESLAIGPLAGG